ncbi:universal stress protein [Aliishimia ponticola]|uniref:Universal stress protein n=1 Tax=Aliishimia ponticola TaxID=2499833 RepID=A0A4S4ND32_9RHOB|nr:universal stress protein [Aliishimia ponticola]THH36665.1 universal stress protein [Aliishimia ponticola]
MYSNILIPIAFESDSDFIVPSRIAKALSDDGAEVTLLHVFETPPSYAIQYVPTDLIEATREGVKAAMDAAAAQVPGGKTVILEGSPGRAIAEYAAKNGTDLVIMASHRPGVGDILWGSTAAFVVRHVNCAVHVIR